MEKSKYEIALEIANKFELDKKCKVFAGYHKNENDFLVTDSIEKIDTALEEYLKRFEKILSTLNKS